MIARKLFIAGSFKSPKVWEVELQTARSWLYGKEIWPGKTQWSVRFFSNSTQLSETSSSKFKIGYGRLVKLFKMSPRRFAYFPAISKKSERFFEFARCLRKSSRFRANFGWGKFITTPHIIFGYILDISNSSSWVWSTLCLQSLNIRITKILRLRFLLWLLILFLRIVIAHGWMVLLLARAATAFRLAIFRLVARCQTVKTCLCICNTRLLLISHRVFYFLFEFGTQDLCSMIWMDGVMQCNM